MKIILSFDTNIQRLKFMAFAYLQQFIDLQPQPLGLSRKCGVGPWISKAYCHFSKVVIFWISK